MLFDRKTTDFAIINSFSAHINERHIGLMSKAAVRQNRTVDVDFSYTRPGGGNSQVSRRRGRDDDDDGAVARPVPQDQGPARLPDMAADFPTLAGNAVPTRPSNGTACSFINITS